MPGWLTSLLTSRTVKAALPIMAFAAAFGISLAYGSPKNLPGAALGSPLLLHALRASALLAVVGVVWLVGWRALHGDFPIKFGNIEYAAEVEASASVAEAQEERLKLIEDYLGLVEPQDDAVE
jgi:hypothetical protein